MTKLIIDFRSFQKAPKKERHDYKTDLPATEPLLMLCTVQKLG